MAAYEQTIMELVVAQLCLGEGLQSSALYYEKAAFLEWLQNEIRFVSFKQVCLANGVEPASYNKYFADKPHGCLNYILQEDVLMLTMLGFIQGQPSENSSLHLALQKKFNLSSEAAKEIITIVYCALDGKYAPSIATKEYNRLLETNEHDFSKIRNTLCYNIAKKEMEILQLKITGSILDDLSHGLKIIISTIELIHYDLLPSLWNKDIYFTIKDDAPQKKKLPFMLYSYYSTLKNLLELASRSQDPAQYKFIFTSKIGPFFQKFHEEESSILTKNLSPHYKWHIIGLDFLYCLPKQILKEKARRSSAPKEEARSSAKFFESLPIPPESSLEIKIDNGPQLIPLQPAEAEVIPTQSKYINSSSSSSEKFELKYETSAIQRRHVQNFSRSFSSAHFKRQEIKAHSTARMWIYEKSIFETEVNSNKKMHAVFLEVVTQKIFEEKGLFSSILHPSYLYKAQESPSDNPQVENETSRFSEWLLHNDIYKDFNRSLHEKLSKSLPEHTEPSDFQCFNISMLKYFSEDSRRKDIAIYAAKNAFLTRKYSIIIDADQCIASFYTSFNSAAVELDKEIAHIKEDYDKAVEPLEYIDKYELMIQDIMKMGKLWMNYREAEKIIAIYGQGLIKPYVFPITFEEYQKLIARKENCFSQIKHEVYYQVAEKVIDTLEYEPSVPLLMRISLRMNYIVTIIELASYDTDLKDSSKILYTFNGQRQEEYIPSALYHYRKKLEMLIKAADSMESPDTYLKKFNEEVMVFQNELSDLIGESIHYTWHSKFLTNLCVMANSLLEKGKEELPSNPVINDQSSSRQRSLSSSYSSFQSESRRRNRSSNAPSLSTVENDSRRSFSLN